MKPAKPTLVLDRPKMDALVARAPTPHQRSVLLQRLTDECGPDFEVTPEAEVRLLGAFDGREEPRVLALFLRQRKADPLTSYLAHRPPSPQRNWPSAAFVPLPARVQTEVLRRARAIDGTLVELHYRAFVLDESNTGEHPGPADAVPGCPPPPLAIRVLTPPSEAPTPARAGAGQAATRFGLLLPADARMPLLCPAEPVPQGVLFRTVWAAFLFCAQRRGVGRYGEPIHAARPDLGYGWYRPHHGHAVPMESLSVGKQLPPPPSAP